MDKVEAITLIHQLECEVNYWRIEAQTDHDRWLRALEELEKYRWQPIETAPKDGTTVLLSFHYLNGVHSGKSFVSMLEWDKAIDGWGLFKNLELDGTLKISHWMPLPKPPTQ